MVLSMGCSCVVCETGAFAHGSSQTMCCGCQISHSPEVLASDPLHWRRTTL